MRYFFNVVLGPDRIADLEGGEFDDLYAALAEAELAAREIAVERLKVGRFLGKDSRIEVADSCGRIHETVEFASLAQKRPGWARGEAQSLKASLDLQHERAKTLMADSRRHVSSMRSTFVNVREKVASLQSAWLSLGRRG